MPGKPLRYKAMATSPWFDVQYTALSIQSQMQNTMIIAGIKAASLAVHHVSDGADAFICISWALREYGIQG